MKRPSSSGWESDFHAVVLAYLNRNKPVATQIVRVGGYGTDWAGDTEDGFYSTFGADVTYLDLDGTERTEGFSGESMGDLWDWVVSGKGSQTPARGER